MSLRFLNNIINEEVQCRLSVGSLGQTNSIVLSIEDSIILFHEHFSHDKKIALSSNALYYGAACLEGVVYFFARSDVCLRLKEVIVEFKVVLLEEFIVVYLGQHFWADAVLPTKGDTCKPSLCHLTRANWFCIPHPFSVF